LILFINNLPLIIGKGMDNDIKALGLIAPKALDIGSRFKITPYYVALPLYPEA
jgi:hypothetical protein